MMTESLEAASASEGERRPPVVLVVDDDPAVRAVVGKVLRRGGYEVLEAASGPEALRIAGERGGRIDLVLTDVVMPGVGGREVSEAIAARCPGMRTLFMSGYTEDEVLLRGIRVAEVDFVPKPFTLEELRGKVREMLDRRARQGPAAAGG